MWPKQAESNTAGQTVFFEVQDPSQGISPAKLPFFETGHLNGFLGIRRAGRELQFRVDVEVGYTRPDDDLKPLNMDHPNDEVVGRLFYEGPAPDNALVFFAPLDEETYHVVVFSLE